MINWNPSYSPEWDATLHDPGEYNCFSWAVECAYDEHGTTPPPELFEWVAEGLSIYRDDPPMPDEWKGIWNEFGKWFSPVRSKAGCIRNGDICHCGIHFGVVLDGKVYHLRAPKRRTEVRMSSLKAVIRQGWEFWRPVTTTERWELV